MCRDELNEQGALLFGPPEDGKSVKEHLCRECFINIKDIINNK